MKYFNMPADFKTSTIDKYDALNKKYSNTNKVLFTYGNITTEDYLASGRDIKVLPKADFDQLEAYVQYSNEKDIGFYYTINATHMNNLEFTEQGVDHIKRFLDKLYAIGVRDLIIAIPSIIELVKSLDYDFKVKASVLCLITNANKAVAFKNMGADSIVIDESLYRDFDQLKRIKNAFGENVSVIVNAFCHQDCHYRVFHYNQISSDSVKKANTVSCEYYRSRCLLRAVSDLANLLKIAWIRPEDIKYYTSIGINHFKIQGRQLILSGDPVRTLEAYFNETYEGNLIDLLYMFSTQNKFPLALDNRKLDDYVKAYFEKKVICHNDCLSCGFCQKYLERNFNFDALSDNIRAVIDFVERNDQFKKLVV